MIVVNEYVEVALWAILLQALYLCGKNAYDIRLHAIKEYGPIIHEFDPYFNYRATEYLYYNGWQKFATWFDYRSWYPLGRPVGTTIYPGMQVSAVFIKNWIVGDKMSLNDVCCYMPAWYGVSASFFTGLIAFECTLPQNSNGSIFTFLIDIYKGKNRDLNRTHFIEGTYIPSAIAGVCTMAIMSMIPAHLMRSVGGGYDNESVAMTTMTLTFWLWCRSLRANDDKSYLYGIATGFAYFYMVAAWGGYIFVLNLIGVHAAVLVLLGRFSTKVYKAYSLFYVIGTTLAIQVPVVGWTPLKSLEQLGPAAVFLGFQVLQFCEMQKMKRKFSRFQAIKFRLQVGLFAMIIGGIVVYFIAPKGYFGPLSSRVRGLFVKHTKTGNPLVDSVAEHQPANADAYKRYVNDMVQAAPIGLALLFVRLGDAPSFLLVYACAAYFFSSKMVRLILLLGPIASILGGIAIGLFLSWCLSNFFALNYEKDAKNSSVAIEDEPVLNNSSKKAKQEKPTLEVKSTNSSFTHDEIKRSLEKYYNFKIILLVRMAFSVYAVWKLIDRGKGFRDYCWDMSYQLSHPTITMKATTHGGQEVIVDDYREAYTWIRDNTPEDSRILAWWDYGYQISAIANRTTIADGNTWNHEHIALLGRVLTSSEKEGHRIARHLADYILVWAGGGGDDLAKSPHLARIANSVYRNMCPGDPTCSRFRVKDRDGNPSKMMSESLLYKLHSHNTGEVKADPNRFKQVYQSKYGKVKVFKVLSVSKESKAWVADPKNRVCDAPGSWFCRGQYPPALQKVLVQKQDFAQLEDFNKDKKDDQYQQQYFEHLDNPSKARKSGTQAKKKSKANALKSSDDTSAPSTWKDTDETTILWEFIDKNDFDAFKAYLKSDPSAAFLRSSDGRGPMWWAFENKRERFIKYLMKKGVSYAEKDRYGKTPLDV